MCGEKKKESCPIPVGKGVIQYHYFKNIGPYPESPFIFQGLKEKSQRCSFPFTECHCRRLHWLVLCSAETLICFGKEKKRRGEIFATERFYLK